MMFEGLMSRWMIAGDSVWMNSEIVSSSSAISQTSVWLKRRSAKFLEQRGSVNVFLDNVQGAMATILGHEVSDVCWNGWI